MAPRTYGILSLVAALFLNVTLAQKIGANVFSCFGFRRSIDTNYNMDVLLENVDPAVMSQPPGSNGGPNNPTDFCSVFKRQYSGLQCSSQPVNCVNSTIVPGDGSINNLVMIGAADDHNNTDTNQGFDSMTCLLGAVNEALPLNGGFELGFENTCFDITDFTTLPTTTSTAPSEDGPEPDKSAIPLSITVPAASTRPVGSKRAASKHAASSVGDSSNLGAISMADDGKLVARDFTPDEAANDSKLVARELTSGGIAEVRDIIKLASGVSLQLIGIVAGTKSTDAPLPALVTADLLRQLMPNIAVVFGLSDETALGFAINGIDPTNFIKRMFATFDSDIQGGVGLLTPGDFNAILGALAGKLKEINNVGLIATFALANNPSGKINPPVVMTMTLQAVLNAVT